MLEILQLCLTCKFQDLKPLSPLHCGVIIKLGGPGVCETEQAFSDDFVRHMFSSWIAMMVSGGQNPVLWLVDFLEGESVCVSVCLSVRILVSSCVAASLYAEMQKLGRPIFLP
jgi:hypothetical protein